MGILARSILQPQKVRGTLCPMIAPERILIPVCVEEGRFILEKLKHATQRIRENVLDRLELRFEILHSPVTRRLLKGG